MYALGYLFQMAVDFWSAARRLYMGEGDLNHPDHRNMDLILSKVSSWMRLEDPTCRRSAAEVLLFFKEQLKTDPNSVQRPLVKLMPSFYPV